MGSGLHRAATTKYPCYVPILGDSEGAGRTGLPVFAAAKVHIFLRNSKCFTKNFVFHPLFRTFAVEFGHPIMTPEEYKQLKAFARQDGALLSLLWIGALICYIQGLTSPVMGMTALLLIVASPFFAATRLRHFRDEAREGIISFMRAYGYTVMTYFYAGLLLAVAIFVYFNFMDNCYLMEQFTNILNTEESKQVIKMYGLSTEQMKQGLTQLSSLRPIDYALNMLTINISLGFLLGIPTAAVMQKEVRSKR